MKVLVKYSADWADEFDVYGFAVFDVEDWEAIKKDLASYDGTLCYSFGTNEVIEYECGADVLADCEEVLISDEFANLLVVTFGNCWGLIPYLGSMVVDAREWY